MPFLVIPRMPHPGLPAPNRCVIPEHSLRGFLPHTPRGLDDTPTTSGQPRGPASPEPYFQPQRPSREASPASVPAAALGSDFGVRGRACGSVEYGSPGGGPSPSAPHPRAGSTLTDTALPILLELELGAALAAELGCRELDALVLAAAVAHGTGVYGWGHRQELWTQPLRMTQPRGLPPAETFQDPLWPSSCPSLSQKQGLGEGTLFLQCSQAGLRFSAHTQGTQTTIHFWVLVPRLPEDRV